MFDIWWLSMNVVIVYLLLLVMGGEVEDTISSFFARAAE